MKALVKTVGQPGAVYQEVPVPVQGLDEVKIRVLASSVCGTDLHIYNWDAWAQKTFRLPMVFGHEFCGIVEAVGEQVTNVQLGDYVSAEGHFACGLCRACRTGGAHVCRYTQSFGITVPGCFAQYTVVPARNIIANSKALPLQIACLQDPLGNAVQAVLSGDVVGKSVAVVGAGPIGLMAIAVAKACGAGFIAAVDINPYRLRMAEQMGSNKVINSKDHPHFAGSLKEAMGGEGPEIVLEMSGHPSAIREAFEAVAHAGRVSLLGIPTGEVPLDLSTGIIFKGVHVHGITGRRMYDTWYQMKGMLEQQRLDLSPLVTHTFTLDQYQEAFELVQSGQCGKIVFLHDV